MKQYHSMRKRMPTVRVFVITLFQSAVLETAADQALSLKARAVRAFWCPLYSLFTSAGETLHNRATLSDDAAQKIRAHVHGRPKMNHTQECFNE